MDRGTLATLLAWRSCSTVEDFLRAELEARMGRPLCRGGVNARKPSVKDHVGIYRQKQAGLNYAGLKVPVGRIRAPDLLEVAALAERYGNGALRLSPAQTIICNFEYLRSPHR